MDFYNNYKYDFSVVKPFGQNGTDETYLSPILKYQDIYIYVCVYFYGRGCVYVCPRERDIGKVHYEGDTAPFHPQRSLQRRYFWLSVLIRSLA